MRKFEEIMKGKLYGATNEYSENIWENVKKELPIAKKSNSRYYWMGAFLCAFAIMIFMVQSYPTWKVNEGLEAHTNLQPLDVSNFILSPEDLAARQLFSSSLQKPTLQPSLTNSNTSLQASVLSTKPNLLSADVPRLIKDEITDSTNEDLVSEFVVNTNANANNLNDLIADVVVKEKAPLYTLANISKFNVGLKIPNYKVPTKRKVKDNDVHCEVLQGRQSKFYVSARHVNSYAFNDLRIKNASADEYMTSRHVSESKKYSFSDEVSLGMEYRNGFFAELGIRYDQINEKFNYQDPNASGQSTVIVSDTIINGGQTEIQTDTITTELTGLREVINNNHFRKVSIPLSIGYQFPLNKKVSLAARSGVVLNVWSKYVGKMFDENLDVVSIGDRQAGNNPFFNKLVHSVSASAYLQYKMTKQMEFLVGLNGYKNLGSASYDSNPIDQKYSSLGIFIGTKYNL